MPANTPSYNFYLPTVGGDTDSWGGYLNSNWDDVDNLLDGTSPVSGIDIDGGTIDGVPIGATVASSGSFTTGSFGSEPINDTLIGNWNTAFGWGDHAAGNYASLSGAAFTGTITPATDGGANLGTGVLGWGSLFLMSGAAVSFANGDTTIGHAAGVLNVKISGGTIFDLTASGMQLGAAGARVSTILDEDDMASDSDTAIPTQQSVKAYVDSKNTGFLHVQHQTNGNGGGNVQNSWAARPLNAEVLNQIAGASLLANQVTLPAGTYRLEGYCVFENSEETQVRIRNVTDNATLILGSSTRHGSGGVNEESSVQGIFTLAAEKDIEFQYYASRAIATVGLGFDVNSGETNVYADLLIQKLV